MTTEGRGELVGHVTACPVNGTSFGLTRAGTGYRSGPEYSWEC